jgi:hypothetical protein
LSGPGFAGGFSGKRKVGREVGRNVGVPPSPLPMLFPPSSRERSNPLAKEEEEVGMNVLLRLGFLVGMKEVKAGEEENGPIQTFPPGAVVGVAEMAKMGEICPPMG